MSRNQKPGKIKLVAGTPRHDRRASDRVSAGATAASNQDPGSLAPAAEQSQSTSWHLILLFLAACALGGAGAAYLDFAAKLAS